LDPLAALVAALITGCSVALAIYLGVRTARAKDPDEQIRIASPLAFLTLGLGFLTLVIAVGMALDP
jgi:hypothetical protein